METLKNPYASKLAPDFRSFDPGIILMIDDHKKCLAKRPGTFFRGFRKSAKNIKETTQINAFSAYQTIDLTMNLTTN